VVLDEAQNIKNASTHAAQVVGELQHAHRLCLSGTPMENHLGEIWSLFHFLMPGFLGSQQALSRSCFAPPSKNRATRSAWPSCAPASRPSCCAAPRRWWPRAAAQGGNRDARGAVGQAGRPVRNHPPGHGKNRARGLQQGLAKSQITILDALLKLRQVCCDPHLLPLERRQKVKESAKLEQLMELLPEMLAEGRRMLLFSQFTSMLALIEAELKAARGCAWVKLTGQSQNRDAIIEQFTSGAVPLFLISLKAGGVGLNLPQADTVIHYDPWWNPAVEAQATDRAHRIGQTQSVWVVKMVAQGTIEERILALQERKAALADSMYSGAVHPRASSRCSPNSSPKPWMPVCTTAFQRYLACHWYLSCGTRPDGPPRACSNTRLPLSCTRPTSVCTTGPNSSALASAPVWSITKLVCNATSTSYCPWVNKKSFCQFSVLGLDWAKLLPIKLEKSSVYQRGLTP
jgi:hypothetical protein